MARETAESRAAAAATAAFVDVRTPTDLPGLARLPGHLLWRAHARVIGCMADTLPSDTDVHAYAALVGLEGASERSQAELAELVSVSATTMGAVADALERDGRVARRRNPADRRSYLLRRTRQGASTARRWRPHVQRLDETLAEGLTPAEQRRLKRLLVRVLADHLSPDTPTQLVDSLGFLVTRAHLWLHRRAAAALRSLDIEPRHFGVMMALTEAGPIPQQALARLLGVSGTTVVQMVDDLQRRGLVVRRPDPADRRTRLLYLGEDAPTVLESARQALTGLSELAVLDADDTADLVALLQTFLGVRPTGR